MMKKRLALLVSALAVFAFAGSAFAGAVDVTVGVPYIQEAVCDQVGNITLEFDDGTVFTVGDQIQIGLVGQPTFCKAVNMLVAAGDANNDASGFGTDVVLNLGTDEPVRATLTGGSFTSTEVGVAFLVSAAVGSDTLTITVVADTGGDGTFGLEGNGTSTFVGGTVDDELQIVLFNEDTYAVPDETTNALFLTGTNPNTMTTSSDNTLCVNTGDNFAGNYVGVGISAEDSDGTKLWDFNPASPNIAIIKSGQTFSLYDCAKSETGTIGLCTQDTSGTQEASSGSNAQLIKNENGTGTPGGTILVNTGPASDVNGFSSGASDAYVAGTHRNNNMVFQTSNGSAFENGTYKLKLEIKVAPANSSSVDDAVSGDWGVYWNTDTIKAQGFTAALPIDYATRATTDSACAIANDQASDTLANVTAYDADGDEIATILPDGTTDCEFDSTASKAVTLEVDETTISDFGVNYTTDGYLLIDLPDMSYDVARLTAGKQVYVVATMTKMPCELVGTGTLLVGTVYDETSSTNTGTASTVTYPYFAEVGTTGQSSMFYNGFTLANTSVSAGAEGTATLTIYEADGDSFTAEVKVMPGAVEAFLLSGLTVTETTASIANTTGDHVFGGQRCWVSVSADFTAYGSAMITHKTDGGVMSYVVGNNTNDN